MATNHPAPRDDTDIMEAVITKGDLGKLTPAERVDYYAATCRSLGLNPLTKPFDYLTLSGKTVLYAGKTAADQLRKINGVSITHIDKEIIDGVLMVTATARDSAGREDTEIGAVTIAGLKGDALANAYMKGLTKAKRRVTLSICGLGFLDETEVETIPRAQPVSVDVETGEIVDAPGRADAAQPDKQRVMARLHAALAAHDIDHEALHAYYAAKRYASVADVPAATLGRMADWASRERRAVVQAEFRRVLSAETPPPEGAEQADLSDLDMEALATDTARARAATPALAGAGGDRWTQ